MSDVSHNLDNSFITPTHGTADQKIMFRIFKRIFDLASAFALLPFLGIAAIMLRLLNPKRNPGPLFFAQTRIGRNGKPFRLLKFRTMVGENTDSRFADQEQARITKFGTLLRNKRVDELPQILNVILGHMSFVGPRPEQKRFVEEYRVVIPFYDDRHQVRPGISGLAQVEHGYTSDADGTRGKLHYDLMYIRNSGFRMEAYVVWRTLATILTGFGAR